VARCGFHCCQCYPGIGLSVDGCADAAAASIMTRCLSLVGPLRFRDLLVPSSECSRTVIHRTKQRGQHWLKQQQAWRNSPPIDGNAKRESQGSTAAVGFQRARNQMNKGVTRLSSSQDHRKAQARRMWARRSTVAQPWAGDPHTGTAPFVPQE
jgi:hypothetical protein